MKGSYGQHADFAGGARIVARVAQGRHGGDSGFFFPIRLSNRRFNCGTKVINLLLLKSGGDCSGRSVQDIAAEVSDAAALEADFLGGEVNKREADGNPDGADDDGELHYVHIQNLDRLLGI
jgi:hypothetical protein